MRGASEHPARQASIHLGFQRLLREAEDDEFGRFHRGNADLADQLACVARARWIRLSIALDVERLVRGCPEEGPGAPNAIQKRGDIPRHACPEVLVVGFEDDPLRTLLDRLLDEVKEPTDVDV